MIAELVRAAWAESRSRTVAAIIATPAVLAIGWFLLVVAIVAGTPA